MSSREERARRLGISIDQLPDGRGKHGQHARGRKHPRWNDGKIINEDGYVKLRVGVGHPLSDPNGYAYEHLVVWVAAGRELPQPGCLLHHKNEMRDDNRLENLEMLSRADHNHLHNQDRRDPTTGRLVSDSDGGR